jgi:hypothetical protein
MSFCTYLVDVDQRRASTHSFGNKMAMCGSYEKGWGCLGAGDFGAVLEG